MVRRDIRDRRALFERCQYHARFRHIASHAVGLSELRQPHRAIRRQRRRTLELHEPFRFPSAEEVRPSQRGARTIVGVEFDGIFSARNGFIEPVGTNERGRDVDTVRQRIEFLGAQKHRDGLIVAREPGAEAPVEIIDVGAARTEVKRSPEFILRIGPRQFRHCLQMAHRAVRFAKFGIEPKRFCRRCGRTRKRDLRHHHTQFDQFDVRHGKRRVRECERRIAGDRALEVLDCMRQRLRRVLDQPLTAPQEQLIRLHIRGGLPSHAQLLVSRELRLERGRNAQRDVGLNGEDIGQLPVIRLHPQMLTGVGIDELCHDAHAFAGMSNTPIQYGGRAQSQPNVFQAVLSLLERHHGSTGNHFQRANFREVRDHIFRDPIGEVFVVRVCAEVLKWQHRDRCGSTAAQRRGRRLSSRWRTSQLLR